MKKIVSFLLICIALLLTSSCDKADMLISRMKENIVDMAEDFTDGTGKDDEAEKITENSISIGMTDFDTFNPLLTESQTVKELSQLIYEPLFEVDNSMRAVPVLAESYSVSPDGLTYNITMKQNIVWHDGKQFDAYDVAYTIKHIISQNTQYTENLADMADYMATGNNTLRIVLKKAIPQFTSLLNFPIVKYQTPMTVNANYKPVGTGAFEYKGKTGIDEHILSAFGMYHRGRAKLDNIYIREAPDNERCQSMFEVSETDIISGKMLDLMTYMPKGKSRMIDFASNRVTYVGFNPKNNKLSDANIRLGLSHLIDKDGIVNSILYSRAVATDVLVNPYSWLYYDLNKDFGAKRETSMQLFKNSGWELDEDGNLKRETAYSDEYLRLVLLVNKNNDTQYNIAGKIKEDFERGGVKVILDEQPESLYNIKLQNGDFDVFVGNCDLGANHNISILTDAPYFAYKNENVDLLIGQLGMTNQEETIMDIYRRLGEIIKNDAPFVPIYYEKDSIVTSAKIKIGISPSPYNALRESNMWSVFE